MLWANLSLLFWLSLVPFEIRWMGEAGIVALPVAAYGGVLMMAAISYMLSGTRADPGGRRQFDESRQRLVAKLKEWLSFAGYAIGFAAAFVHPLISILIYIGISLSWFVPDRRFERNLQG